MTTAMMSVEESSHFWWTALTETDQNRLINDLGHKAFLMAFVIGKDKAFEMIVNCTENVIKKNNDYKAWG